MQRRMKMRLLLGGLALLGLGTLMLAVFRPRTRPNVILVTLDTTRADHIGCYGYPQARTPAIDALAERGVRLERAYAPAPVTLPSHASMLTGLYPPEHGLHSNGRGRLGSGIPILSEILRNANYETGAFVGAYVLDAKFGLNRGFQTYDDDLSQGVAGDEPAEQRRSGQTVVDAALAWLDARHAKPFFCWIHLYDAHAYYDPRRETFGDEFAERPYDAGIAFADLQVERLREYLERRKLTERTLIVIAGDHGEDLMEHQETQHGNQLYETTLRVPLVFCGSPCVQPAQRIEAPVSLVDLMPTILDCLDVRQPSQTSGRSIKGALTGGRIEPRPCYAETDIPFLENRWAPLRGLVTDRWKYIKTTRSELYDLAVDPKETKNLAESEPDQLHELQQALDDLCGRMAPREAGSVNLTANERRILESLGYSGGQTGPSQPEAMERLPDIKEMLPLYNELMIARTHLRDGDVEGAVAKLERVLEQAPNYFQARLVMGDALSAQKRFEEAAEIYRAVADARPDIGDAEGRWANALAAQGHFVEAVPHYRKVLEILPEETRYRIRLALALVQLGRRQEAIVELEAAVRGNPNDADAHMELGNLLMQGGRMGAAIPHYEAVLKVQPQRLLARLNLASALAQERHFDAAVAHATEAVASEPKSFEARYTLGMILVVQKRYREAIPHLTEASRLHPDDADVHERLRQARAALVPTGN